MPSSALENFTDEQIAQVGQSYKIWQQNRTLSNIFTFSCMSCTWKLSNQLMLRRIPIWLKNSSRSTFDVVI